MIKFKNISENILGNPDISCLQMKKGEVWSIAIPQEAIPQGCADYIYLVNLKKDIGNCDFQENVAERKYCLVKPENNDKAKLNLIIKDKEDIPNFILFVDDEELIDFVKDTTEDITDFEQLILYLESLQISYDISNFGLELYFNKKYSGKEAKINSTELYFLNPVFCYVRVPYFNLTFSINENGKYRLAFIKNDEILSWSDTIEVVNFEPKGVLAEYYLESFYIRQRLPIQLLDEEILTEEEETILSSGELAISGKIFRPQQRFETYFLNTKEHLELLTILKTGFKVSENSYVLRGEYGLSGFQKNRKSQATGTFTIPNLATLQGANCETDCNLGSSLIISTKENLTISQPVSLGIPTRQIKDEFYRNSGTTVTLTNIPDLTKDFRVYRNGLRLQSDEYTQGQTITFTEPFGSGEGGNPIQVEYIIVEYYLL